MVTPGDWIRVELSPDDVARAQKIGQLRQDYATRRGFKAYGLGSVETHIDGVMGELAVARYEQSEVDSDWTWEADKRRGYDVAGWQVRTRSRADYGLPINVKNQIGKGDFLLVLSHQRPVMNLVGWISAVAGAEVGRWRYDHGVRWFLVEQRNLQPLPEQNGYGKRPHDWLVDPATPFWHEECHGVHPIAEHRICDSARQRMLIERSRRVLNTIYPPTEEAEQD